MKNRLLNTAHEPSYLTFLPALYIAFDPLTPHYQWLAYETLQGLGYQIDPLKKDLPDWESLIHPDDKRMFRKLWMQALAQVPESSGYIRLKQADLNWTNFQVSVKKIPEYNPIQLVILAVLSVSEVKPVPRAKVNHIQFTTREAEIIDQILDGANTREIARKLDLSVHTIATYRKNLMRKLKVHNTAQLIRKAWELGWDLSKTSLL